MTVPKADLREGDYAVIAGTNPCSPGTPVEARQAQALRIVAPEAT